MESERRTSGMSLPENLRPKQKETIEAYAENDCVIVQLPVGYGKTKTAAGSFAQLNFRAAANRMLYIVPRINQAYQAAESVPEALKEFGIQTRAVIVGDDQVHAKRVHAADQMCCFIATVQSLLSRATMETIQDLMRTGKWFAVVDEHHHYSTDGNGDSEWTRKLKTLNWSAMLAMSATANRHDGTDHFPDPEITETYRGAAEAGYVKRLSLHAYEYQIDAVTVDGLVYHFTTEELAEQAGSEKPDAIDAHLTSRRMRFSPKYVSPLVTFPMARLVDLRLRGIKSQMLIQAMSCAHAQCVVEQVRMLLPESMSVDWVGTGEHGRKPRENEDVIKQFCPAKDKLTGKRPWTLDVLVNVGIASEGLDTVDVTEISFLTPANITITNLQTIGRGSRLMLLGDRQQPTCHINVDTGSDMAEHIGKGIELLFDRDVEAPEDVERERKPAEPPDYEPLPEKLGWVIADVELVDIRSEPMFKVVRDAAARDLEQRGLRAVPEQIDDAAERAIRKYLNQTSNESAILAQKREQVDLAANKIASLIMRRKSEAGIRPERSEAGDLKKRINTQKRIRFNGRVKDLDEAELEQQYSWLKEIERSILLAHGLNGLPSWLR